MSLRRLACGAAQDTRHNSHFPLVGDDRHARSLPWVSNEPLAGHLLDRSFPTQQESIAMLKTITRAMPMAIPIFLLSDICSGMSGLSFPIRTTLVTCNIVAS